MRKKLLPIFLMMIAFHLEAQNTPTESDGFSPKITFPSPEAASFTRYGDIPVGLFTGSMNYSVPLTEIRSGKLSVPVTLNYTSNGIKVDAVSGRTGMDWNLNVGGVITRNIMGKPDDLSALVAPSSDDSVSSSFYTYVKNVAAYNYNTQPDEYTYNFFGQSGKFYFDYTGNIRELSPSGLKITGGSYGFSIVTLDGTEYNFSSGDDSYSYSLFGDNDPFNSDGGRTSWYLTKIKNNLADSIVYNYEYINPTIEPITYLSGISQTYKGVSNLGGLYLFDAHYLKSSSCSYFGDIGSITMQGKPFSVITNTDIRVTAINVVKLSEVIFKEGKLKLYYSSREDLPGEQKLDSIEMISGATNGHIKSVGFKYAYSQASSTYNIPGSYYLNSPLQESFPYLKKRLFLEKVNFYNRDKSDSQYYKFEYDTINNLPPRLSFAQDYFGYFNGKSNTNFLPTNTMFQQRIWLNTSSRSVDSVYNKAGLLTKIFYPTGGYSRINYQSNYLEDGTIGLKEVFDTISLGLNYSTISPSEQSDAFKCNQPYVVKVSAEWITPPDYNGPLSDSNVVFNIKNLTTNTNEFLFGFSVVPGSPVEIVDQLYHLNRSDDYILTLEGGNADVRGKAEFIHFKDVPDTTANYPTAGVRVSSIKNFTADNAQAGFKRFDYAKPDGVSSGTMIIHFNDGRDYSYPERSIVADAYYGNYVLSSTSLFGNFANDYGTINYPYATELYDSIGTSGRVTTQFLVGKNTLSTTFACLPPSNVWDHSPFLIPGAPTTNTGYMSGKEFKKTWYKNLNGTPQKIKELTNYYSTDARLYNSDSFFVIRKVYDRSSYTVAWKYFADYDINKYKRISAWVHIDSTIQKEFDEANNELAVKTAYVYGNETHLLPTEISTTTSKGEELRTVSKYPHDFTGQSIYDEMIYRHMWSPVIEQENYKNNNFLQSVKTNYNTWSSSTSNTIILPQTIQTKTLNNDYETRFRYYLYDGNGNITSASKENDSKTSYIWDYTNTYLVSKIVGADSTSIAYTSFEADGKGKWTYSGTISTDATCPTGSISYNLSSGNITKSSLNSGTTYIVSYWSKNGSYTLTGSNTPKQGKTIDGWTYYEHEITSTTSFTISGSGYIDELRLYPKGALMTTYTYSPLIGLTSQCDANNRISYYEYDSFGRLKLIRDQDKNVVKVMDYKYQAAPQQ